jgi:hypothetical protein
MIRRQQDVPSNGVGPIWLLASLLLVLFVIYPFVSRGGVGRLAVTLGLTAILVAGCLQLPQKGLRRIALTLAAVAFVAQWLDNFTPRSEILVIARASTMVFLALSAYGILSRVLRGADSNLHRLVGAITVYLMLGLVGGFGYSLIELRKPGSIHLPDLGAAEEAVEAVDPTRDLIYFSFVTLSTLGYGDVTPKSQSARTLATIEALIGQIYLVTLIAHLVSLRVADERDNAA